MSLKCQPKVSLLNFNSISTRRTNRASARRGDMQAVETFVPRTALRLGRLDLRMVTGLLLTVFAIAGGISVINKAQARIPVVVAAKSVEPGVVISSSDLKVAHISTDGGVAYLSAAELARLTGSIATEPLWPGKIIGPRSITRTSHVPPGYVAMSLSLKPAQAADGKIRSGDQVAVISADPPDRPDAKTTILFSRVSVLSVRSIEGSEGTGVIVALQLRLEEARVLSEAKASGTIDLVLLSRESER